MEEAVTSAAVWTIVAVVGAGTLAMKGAGPVLLGGRALPPRVMAVVSLLAPAVLAALIVTNTVGGDHRYVLDARLAGVAAAAIALRLRAPLLVVVILAAAVTATIRAIS
jgi:branched-subunit amino acid transport protein